MKKGKRKKEKGKRKKEKRKKGKKRKNIKNCFFLIYYLLLFNTILLLVYILNMQLKMKNVKGKGGDKKPMFFSARGLAAEACKALKANLAKIKTNVKKRN